MNEFENLDDYFGAGLAAPHSNTDSNSESAFSMGNGFVQLDATYASQGNFQGGNDDLNGFFTPSLDGPGKSMLLFGNGNEMMPQAPWDNGEGMQMFDQQQFPFPIQASQMQPQLPLDPNSMMGMAWTGSQNPTPSIEKDNTTAASEELADAFDEIEKPKRGRPRRRKRKDPLSEAEQQRKREAFLERNRRAASKCRKRKKESTENIQARVSKLDKESRILTAELIHLRAEYAQWLNVVLQHANACPDSGIFQATLDAVAKNRLAVSEERAMDYAFTRQTMIDMDQNSMTESMSPPDTSHASPTDMDGGSQTQHDKSPMTQMLVGRNSAERRETEMRLGISFDKGGLNPLDTSRDFSNIEIKLENERLQKIEDDRGMSRTNWQQHNGATISPNNLQLNTSIARTRSNSTGSNSSSTRTGISSNKDSGYETSVTTTPSPRKLESPDLETADGRTIADSKYPLKADSQSAARTLRSGTVISEL